METQTSERRSSTSEGKGLGSASPPAANTLASAEAAQVPQPLSPQEHIQHEPITEVDDESSGAATAPASIFDDEVSWRQYKWKL